MEHLRSITVDIEVDTNKRTEKVQLALQPEESVDELMERATAYVDDVLDRESQSDRYSMLETAYREEVARCNRYAQALSEIRQACKGAPCAKTCESIARKALTS